MSPTYRSWAAMRTRCLNPNNPDYPHWGGRGISICESWASFSAFLADMGDRPVGTTLDRINNDGNYELSNCKWLTKKEQAHNRRVPPKVASCDRGHLFTPENTRTYLSTDGYIKRGCRKCGHERYLAVKNKVLV